MLSFAEIVRGRFEDAYERIAQGGGYRDWDEVYCPECGGDLELVETIDVEVSRATYDFPADYERIGYVYRCPECGEEFITKKEI